MFDNKEVHTPFKKLRIGQWFQIPGDTPPDGEQYYCKLSDHCLATNICSKGKSASTIVVARGKGSQITIPVTSPLENVEEHLVGCAKEFLKGSKIKRGTYTLIAR